MPTVTDRPDISQRTFSGFPVRGGDGATLIPATPMEILPDARPDRKSDLFLGGAQKNAKAGDKPFVDLIVPSLSLDPEVLKSIDGPSGYEERALWQMASLGPAEEGRPPIRQAMVLSQAIAPSTFEYVLQLLGGIRGSQSKDRLVLFLGDNTSDALTGKILKRPEILKKLHDIGGDGASQLLVFVGSEDEQLLADTLGIPMFATDPKLNYWGSKPGSRAIFEDQGVPLADGTGECRSLTELATGIADLLKKYPEAKKVVVKLSDGFSGDGNGILDVGPLQKALTNGDLSQEERVKIVEEALPQTKLMGGGMTWEMYARKVPEMGAIAEMFIDGKIKSSPSVQGKVHDDGTVEIISTHEQLLGGEDGQVFLGAKFPADESYRAKLHEYGEMVGKGLAEKGALGRFAVDFMAVKEKPDDEWDVRAIEINLREGGTTHIWETTRMLTQGSVGDDGIFRAGDGTPKYYVASDNIKNERYVGMDPADAVDIAHKYGLHFDHETQTGIAFHMLGHLRDFGKVGVTCIADTPEEAQKLYDDTIKALDAETGERPLRAKVAKETEALPTPPEKPSAKPSPPLFLIGDRQTLLRPKDGIFNDWMRSVSFSPDHTLLAAAVNNRGDYSVRINDRVSGAELHSLTGPTMPIRQVAFGPKNRVVAGAADGSVTVWDATGEKQLWSVRNPDLVNSVAFSRDGELVAAGDAKGSVVVYEAETGKQVFKAKGQEGWVRTVAFSPSGDHLAVGFADGTVRLFDVSSGEEQDPFKGHPGGAYEVSFSDDGRLMAVSSGNGSLSVWHVKERRLLDRLERDWKTGKVAFAPGGERLAFGSSDGSVRLYDWKSRTETKIRNFDSTPTSLKQEFQLGPVRWTENGHTLTAVSAQGALHEWNFA